MEIEMEARRCEKCNAPFRVLKTSKVKTCSTMCAEHGVPGPGTNRLAAGPKLEKIVIAPAPFRKPADPKQAAQAEIKNWLQTGPNGRERLPKNTAQRLLKGDEKVQETNTVKNSERIRPSGKPQAKDTKPTTRATPKPSEREVQPITEKTKHGEISVPATIAKQPPSEKPRATLETAALDSMSLLQKSGNKLMLLLDECVSEQDLDRSEDGTRRVESHRIQQAVETARALAQTVQVQVNMVKAVADFMGNGE